MSDWINFVKKFARGNGLTYGDALKVAGPYYHGGAPVGGARAGGARRRRRGGTPVGGVRRRRGGAPVGGLEEELYGMGEEIGQIIGGAAKPKGALAALLSGLDAHISVD